MERQIISSPNVPKSPLNIPQAVKAGPWLFPSCMMATDYKSGVAPEARVPASFPTGQSRIRVQTRYIFEKSQEICKAAGTDVSNMVRTDQFRIPEGRASGSTVPSIQDYLDERNRWLKPPRPASTGCPIDALPVKGCVLGLDWIGLVPEKGSKKEGFETEKIPKPIAAFSEAVVGAGFVFVAGMVATDQKTGLAPPAIRNPNFWYGSDIKLQTQHILKEIDAVLQGVGSSLQHVVKASVYLTDMEDIFGVDEVWREYFPNEPPARSFIPFSIAPGGIPNCKIEITATAIIPSQGVKKQTIKTSAAPTPILHEPQAVRAGNLLYLSQQFAVDEKGISPAATMEPDFPYFGISSKKQMEVILKNIGAICDAAGTSIKNLVKNQWFHTNLSEFYPAYEAWSNVFSKSPPAASVVGVKPPLAAPACTVQLDPIAMID